MNKKIQLVDIFYFYFYFYFYKRGRRYYNKEDREHTTNKQQKQTTRMNI